ncbi:MAG: XkdX family protein [Ruminococcaceae bacterium]|nr:XkdX family protein [Oscillospiraceae bacterium]
MEHSAKFEKVKAYYKSGLWNITKVRNAVVKGWITEAEFEEITGITYE